MFISKEKLYDRNENQSNQEKGGGKLKKMKQNEWTKT